MPPPGVAEPSKADELPAGQRLSGSACLLVTARPPEGCAHRTSGRALRGLTSHRTRLRPQSSRPNHRTRTAFASDRIPRCAGFCPSRSSCSSHCCSQPRITSSCAG
jgi:hypothetical protein